MKNSLYTEDLLFKWLKREYIPDLERSEDQYSFYDCYSDEFKIHIELKCRKVHYQSLIIEKRKYLALIKMCKQHKTKPIYINSTPNGVWAFYIEDLDIEWQDKALPETTDFSNSNFIDKSIGYLDVSKGVELSSILKL
jgi:hypothetical protein